MTGSSGGAGGYQAIKEMIGMYAFLICFLFSILFQINRVLAVAKTLLPVKLLSWRSCTEKFAFAKVEKQDYKNNDLT